MDLESFWDKLERWGIRQGLVRLGALVGGKQVAGPAGLVLGMESSVGGCAATCPSCGGTFHPQDEIGCPLCGYLPPENRPPPANPAPPLPPPGGGQAPPTPKPPGPVPFDLFLQDESNGNVLLFHSRTGDYRMNRRIDEFRAEIMPVLRDILNAIRDLDRRVTRLEERSAPIVHS